MTRIGWLDASSGISGDMLLGACVDAGVPLEIVQRQLDRLGLPEPITLVAEDVMRGGIAATHVHVNGTVGQHFRGLSDVLRLIEGLDLGVRIAATETFQKLAAAEAHVHRIPIEQVHFHELGALDSIADVVGVVTAVQWLRLDRLVCSPIALGSGRAATDHGSIPVPSPAVMELLVGLGIPAHGGPIEYELATPTGVALAATLTDDFGPMPLLAPQGVGTGAGTWNPDGHANVARIVIGSDPSTGLNSPWTATGAVVLEANVDDLDPRLWPNVLAALMEAGAADAWLTPIVMKKGRPAHSVSVLAAPDLGDILARVLFAHTSTIGLRRSAVDKLVLPRQAVTAEIGGGCVSVKVAYLDGAIVNVSAEYDDVARIATATGRPVKAVLAEAMHAARELLGN